MDDVQADARQIFQGWLDTVGEAIMAADFDRFATMVGLPCILSSRTMRHVITTRDDLRRGFDGFAATIRGHEADQLVRRAQHVDFAGPGLILGFYVTDIIAHSAKVVPSFTSSMLLRHGDNGWKCVEVTSGLANQSYPFSVLRRPPGT